MVGSYLDNLIVRSLNHLSHKKPQLRRGEIVLGKNEDDYVLWKVKPGFHLHIVGATRSGKSKLLELILQGLTYQGINYILLDIHGDTVSAMNGFLHSLPAHITQDRIIYIDFSQHELLPGLNPLSAHRTVRPSVLVNMVLSSLRHRWRENWGVRIEQVLRNSLWTLTENNLTLLELRRLLTDSLFRAQLVSSVTNPEVRAFWGFFDSLSDSMRATWIDPVLNKLSAHLTDQLVRRVLGQVQTSIPFKQILDTSGKILLVNFAKGVLQSESSELLASLFFPALVGTIFSRANVPLARRTPFILAIDEAQSFPETETALELFLSEAGKYGLQLIIAHQHFSQFPSHTRSALLGNCSGLCAFRSSPEDARLIAPAVAPGRERMLESRLVTLNPRNMLFSKRDGEIRFVRTPYVKSYSAPDLKHNRFIMENLKAGILRPRRDIEKEISQRSKNRRANQRVTNMSHLNYQEGQNGW